MKNLTKGANAFLTNSGIVRVHLNWKSPRVTLEAVCFAVTTSGKVPNDEWFLFYNQPCSPRDAINFSQQPGSSHAEFIVNLDQLPADIQKCVFAAALDQGSFQEVTDATIIATPRTGEALTFAIADATDEHALIFAEIYRHASGWKMRAVGQGFKGGLQPLAEHYGVTIADEPSTPTPLPLPSAGEIKSISSAPLSSAPPAPPALPAPARRRSGFLKKVIVFFGVALLVVGASAWTLNYYYPQLLFLMRPSESVSSNKTQAEQNYVTPTCLFSDEQVFDRYHSLGENYVKILKVVDISNESMAKIRDELRMLSAKCSDSFKEKNAKEIKYLESFDIKGWMEEAVQLNTCAGIMNKNIEIELNNESRPNIVQRLLRNVDRLRNLESDLTNISRDLAYLNNKKARLVEGYKSNIEACLK